MIENQNPPVATDDVEGDLRETSAEPGITPRRSRSGRTLRWYTVPLAVVLACIATLLPMSATPAQADMMYATWSFEADALCDRTTREISFQVMVGSNNYVNADTGYRVWMRYNNGAWSGPTNWKMFYNRNAYWDGPRLLYRGSGTYQFYVEYAIYTTSGWKTFGEYANHRISAGGFTNSGGASSCWV